MGIEGLRRLLHLWFSQGACGVEENVYFQILLENDEWYVCKYNFFALDLEPLLRNNLVHM